MLDHRTSTIGLVKQIIIVFTTIMAIQAVLMTTTYKTIDIT